MAFEFLKKSDCVNRESLPPFASISSKGNVLLNKSARREHGLETKAKVRVLVDRRNRLIGFERCLNQQEEDTFAVDNNGIIHVKSVLLRLGYDDVSKLRGRYDIYQEDGAGYFYIDLKQRKQAKKSRRSETLIPD